jgi:hypothetical protein
LKTYSFNTSTVVRFNIMSLKTETDVKVPRHLFHINSMQKKIKSRTESCRYKKRLPPFLLLCLPVRSTRADDRTIKSTLRSKKPIATLPPAGIHHSLWLDRLVSASILQKFLFTSFPSPPPRTISNQEERKAYIQKETLTFFASACRPDSPVQTSE